jgi:hypothetical protein
MIAPSWGTGGLLGGETPPGQPRDASAPETIAATVHLRVLFPPQIAIPEAT